MIWHWLEGKREDLAPFSSPRENLPVPTGEGGRRPAPPWNLPSFLHLQIAPHLLPHLSPKPLLLRHLFVRRLVDAPALLLLLLVGATERPSSSAILPLLMEAQLRRRRCRARCLQRRRRRPTLHSHRTAAPLCNLLQRRVRRQVSEQQRAMVPWMAPSRWSRNRLQGFYSI